MYSKNNNLDLSSYINCLWNFFQTYYKTDQIKKNQKDKWLEIIERSKLKLNKNNIVKLIKNPDYIFCITNFKDIGINKVQLLKLRYFICLKWLDFLLVDGYNLDKVFIINFDSYLLSNWTESIDTLVSTFESRNEILISERDTIYNNLTELEKIKIKYPNLDQIHQIRLQNQLKALRHILNLESTDELRELRLLINKLNSSDFNKIDLVIKRSSNATENFKTFIELFEHISNELLTKITKNNIKLFEVNKEDFSNIVNTNLSVSHELYKYQPIIFNTKSLTWDILNNIKLIEQKINLHDLSISNLILSKTSKVCNLIYKTIEENSRNLICDGLLDELIKIQNNILLNLDNLFKIKNNNYNIICKLEKDFNYSDLKDIDLEFYYQYLTHLNTIIVGIKNSKVININTKKYLSNEMFLDRKNFNNLIKSLNNQFVSKKEFSTKINQIENRLTHIEENKTPYILGTMVISLISLSIWKKMINFKKEYL